MSKKAIGYLHLLAETERLLYITQEENSIVTKASKASKAFSESYQMPANETIFDELTTILSKNDISIVVLDSQNDNGICPSFYEKIKEYDENILIMLMINTNNCTHVIELFPEVDMLVGHGISEELLEKKLFNLLAPKYTRDCLLHEQISTQKKVEEKESISEYLDTYEGSSLFISDELLSILKELDSGVLSHDTLVKVANEVEEVANIFNAMEKTKSVVPVYKELVVYLKKLDLHSIKPENIKGFEYLSDILADISVYLIDMFVERTFKDVYIFKDSLKNNIEFMKNALDGAEDDTSELDFF